jgi:hypothetical protein
MGLHALAWVGPTLQAQKSRSAFLARSRVRNGERATLRVFQENGFIYRI